MARDHYVERSMRIKCRGRGPNGKVALKKPVEAKVKINQSRGVTQSFSCNVEGCDHTAGGHGQRCKAYAAGESIFCPFAFDYPHVLEFNPQWASPPEIKNMVEKMKQELF